MRRVPLASDAITDVLLWKDARVVGCVKACLHVVRNEEAVERIEWYCVTHGVVKDLFVFA
jgi:predicted type IV restriction endonuclease